MAILEKITTPADLKSLSRDELSQLAAELRQTILNTVAANGGHLSSNLGIVEVTLALHKIFNAPDDRIIFDVSHQSYAHKLLTGRYKNFSTLRQAGGISGFANPAESEYDPMYEGHCGTSVSEALAFAVANSLDGKDNYAVAVVGDGAFTNGMIYEALNNCGDKELRLIIVLNDNEMSISENIGGLNKLLRRLRSSAGYFRFKHGTQKVLRTIPVLGKALILLGRKIKNVIKNLILQQNIFESLGMDYIGPVNGNDLKQTCSAFAEAKRRGKCCVVHLYTKKGLGYPPAESEPAKYHAVPPFDIQKGVEEECGESFSTRFGNLVTRMADGDDRICAITAAMGMGTGLTSFEAAHPDRFFDVGIAEEHAITFGAGLAAAGKLPVCAIYSTFAQRVYDQLFQDVSLAGYHFLLALDRAGFVGGDGVTHQGIFDYSIFSSLPGVTIYSPANFAELDTCIVKSLSADGLQIVRYPKGGEGAPYDWQYTESGDIAFTAGVQNCEKVIVTYGRIAANALPLTKKGVGIVRFIRAYPPDYAALNELIGGAVKVLLLEEGIAEGGFAQKLAPRLSGQGKQVYIRAVEGFVYHGSLEDMYRSQGMTCEQIGQLFEK